MNRKITSVAFLSLALLLSACGGFGSSDSMSDKDYIVILRNVPAGICESTLYRDTLKGYGFKGILTEETATDTSCETYGKSNDGQYCAEELYDNGEKNCVVGFDKFGSSDVSLREKNAREYWDLDIATNTILEQFLKEKK